MNEQQKYIDDLRDIKDMMTRSSRFISLSGITGVLAGTFALLGAFVAYQNVYKDQDYFDYRKADIDTETIMYLLVVALLVLILSVTSGIFFTVRKARRNKHSTWDAQSKRLVINLLIPLATGGILSLILLFKGYVGIIAPLTLIFYGLALVNASKYTLTEIRGLGLIEICLGLVAAYFIGHGLLFWAIGFGVMHIIYGINMHIKYGS
jgi:hypothetical protein